MTTRTTTAHAWHRAPANDAAADAVLTSGQMLRQALDRAQAGVWPGVEDADDSGVGHVDDWDAERPAG